MGSARGFRRARAALNAAEGGVLVLDLLGGPAAERDDCVERRNAVTGAVFVWEQERFEPVSREIVCHLSLRDGAEVKPKSDEMLSAMLMREALLDAAYWTTGVVCVLCRLPCCCYL